MKVSTSTLGFPRMGPKRELKFALEKYWHATAEGQNVGASSENLLQLQNELLNVAYQIEDQGWKLQKNANIDRITVGDYYLYDGILQWANMIGIIPQRFHFLDNKNKFLSREFAMARGINEAPALSKLMANILFFLGSYFTYQC